MPIAESTAKANDESTDRTGILRHDEVLLHRTGWLHRSCNGEGGEIGALSDANGQALRFHFEATWTLYALSGVQFMAYRQVASPIWPNNDWCIFVVLTTSDGTMLTLAGGNECARMLREHSKPYAHRFIAVITACLCSLATVGTHGQGIEVVTHIIVDTPSGPLAVYRIYAIADGPFQLLALGAQPGHPTVLSTTCRSPFFNPLSGMVGPPTEDMINADPMNEWDTFVTIGLAVETKEVKDQAITFPEWPPFMNANTYSISDHVMYVTPDAPQSHAIQGGSLWRILIAQLTVSADDGIINSNPLSTLGFLIFRSPSNGTWTLYDYSLSMLTFVGRCCIENEGGCVFTQHYTCDVTYGGQMIGCQPCTRCNSCYGDLAPPSGDDRVGVMDLLRVVEQWGPCWNCSSDIAPETGDGLVGVPDLLAVINNWGPCK